MKLKLISFNVHPTNKRRDDIYEFVKSQKADIVCLQEVSKPLLERLSELKEYAILSTGDAYVSLNRKKVELYLVTLIHIRHAVNSSVGIRFKKKKSLKEPFAKALRYILRRWFGAMGFRYIESIGYQYVSIRVKKRSGKMLIAHEEELGIYNLHLENITRPSIRLDHFEQARKWSEKQSAKSSLYFGDFNVLSPRTWDTLSPWYKRLWHLFMHLWFAIYHFFIRPMDKNFFRDEFERFEKNFKKANLVNVLNGRATHDLTGCQMDYILVPENSKIHSAKLHDVTFSSDHWPVIAVTEIEL